jgi:hypothetical protein
MLPPELTHWFDGTLGHREGVCGAGAGVTKATVGKGTETPATGTISRSLTPGAWRQTHTALAVV